VSNVVQRKVNNLQDIGVFVIFIYCENSNK